jgi:hypothetical protein
MVAQFQQDHARPGVCVNLASPYHVDNGCYAIGPHQFSVLQHRGQTQIGAVSAWDRNSNTGLVDVSD